MKALLPVILALTGIAAGVGAGIALKPAPAPELAGADPCGDAPAVQDPAAHAAGNADHGAGGDVEYAELSDQFIVPVVLEDRVTALVVLSLSIEVPAGKSDAVYSKEPKLRDAFLQVLFDYANLGGFRGNFTELSRLDGLRESLRRVAGDLLPGVAGDVLIVNILRQDA